MDRKILTAFVSLSLVSMGFLTGLTHIIPPVKASDTILIGADGSIYPQTTPISTPDNITYVLTDNIRDFSIVIQRDHIVVDGSGFVLQGPRDRTGISLTNRINVTIKNLEISRFNDGISLENSSHNIMSGNNITDNADVGIDVSNSPDNVFSGNAIANNANCGLEIHDLSVSNSVIGNNITNSANGIHVAFSPNVTILGNIITSCSGFGMLLESCQNNSLVMNTISNSGRGMYTSYCSLNNLTGNTVLNNLGGIWLGLWSKHNTLRSNNMSGNEYNFGANPNHMDLKFWVNDVDTSNTVNGRPIYYWVQKQNMTVPLDAGQVTLVNCTGITVQNLTLADNWQGIQLASTTGSTITNSNITDNWDGIRLTIRSSDNLIFGNIIANNVAGAWFGYSSGNRVFSNDIRNNNKDVGIYENIERGGIVLYDARNYSIFENNIASNVWGIEHIYSSSNYIHHNNISGNALQTYSPYGYTSWENTWDNGYPSGGNYWGDYTGTDVYSGLHQNETSFDFVGDSPYVIDQNNSDSYPLMLPFVSGMQEEERVLLIYSSMMHRFNKTYSDFQVLNSTVKELIASITNLQREHDYFENMASTLREQVNSLNITVTSLQNSLREMATILNATRESLQSEINSLNQTCISLNQSLATLKTQISSINSTMQASINDLQTSNKALSNRLDIILEALYILIATTIVLAVATVYFTLRRPKTKHSA